MSTTITKMLVALTLGVVAWVVWYESRRCSHCRSRMSGARCPVCGYERG